jgi:hypothetical protein
MMSVLRLDELPRLTDVFWSQFVVRAPATR